MKDDIKDNLISYFDIDLLIRFGNSKNNAHDIDLLIVSDSFIGISTLKRKQLVLSFDNRIDPICLTNIQFNHLKKSGCRLYKNIISNYELLYGNPTNIF